MAARKRERVEKGVPVDRARRVLRDPQAVRRLVAQAQRKAKAVSKEVPPKVWARIQLLGRMVTAYAKGQYREFPLRTILLAVAALLYFVNPFDLIPDWIVGVGLLDDASVIAFVLNSIQRDVSAFQKWERSTHAKGAAVKTKPVRRPGSRHRRSPTAA